MDNPTTPTNGKDARPGFGARFAAWWHRTFGPSRVERTAVPDDERGWDAVPLSENRKVGVACSGGGIRSASFCLGALQAIDASTVDVQGDNNGLDHVDYVAAVSGGGYTAGGWAVTTARNAERGVAEKPRIFAQGSPEEERLRRNSSLLPNTRTGAAGFGRLTIGLAINLLILWGLMIVVAAPIGWITSSDPLHPELRARTPLLQIEEQPQFVRDDAYLAEDDVPLSTAITELDEPRACSTGACPVWEVSGLELTDLVVDSTTLEGETTTISPSVSPDPETPMLIVLDAGEFVVVQQPRVDLTTEDDGAADEDASTRPVESEGAADNTPALAVEQQPELSVTQTPATAPTADMLRVDKDPVIAQRSGFTGRPPVNHSSTMHFIALASVTLALVLGILRIVLRPTTKTATNRWRLAVRWTSVAAAVVVTFIYVVPWIIVTVPPFIEDLPSWIPFLGGEQLGGSSLVNTTAFAFFLTLVETGLRAVKGPATRAIRKWPIRVARIGVVFFFGVVLLAVFADILEVAAANGPMGHLSDFVLQPTFTVDREIFGLDVHLSVPDIARWGIVILLLWGWNRLADAHSWSLFPFYKRWISRAFLSQRSKDFAPRHEDSRHPLAPAPADPVDFSHATIWTDSSRLGSVDDGPELIACCAVNLNDVNASPSGRKAGSFVFSSDYIGGPDVGWMPTEKYWNALPHSRKKDITVVATMAISGAAISPGMGKLSMGSVGGLMALVNARLGVWLPHPREVSKLGDRQWKGRPGWTWWFREVIQRFRSGEKYLYISDGGHWENLGVIELLRRGCNHVYVISAAGDGVDGFTTVGEAIAIAREELGIEIEGIDLDDMRTPRGDPAKGEDVLVHADGSTTRFAKRSYSVGTLRHVGEKKPYGTIVVIEANLSAHMPWDVQAHAEKYSEFPSDSTLDQFFDDRQFESYRRLGHLQTGRALEAVSVDEAETDPRELMKRDDRADSGSARSDDGKAAPDVERAAEESTR